MADRPSARDEDRLPWLEPFGDAERARRRKPVSRTALVGLLVAFFGVGLAVAFSLGYRLGRPVGEASAPAPTRVVQPERTASVQVPLAPPAAQPRVEPVAPPPAVVEPPAAEPKPALKAKPTAKKARTVRHKARHVRHAKKKPILRPFLNVKPPPARAPVTYRPSVPPGPKGRVVQLGAFSTQRQAELAWRSIVWRYPYLGNKTKAIFATPPVGGHRYYRLQVATESQAQSLVICQYLQARGQSCILLY